MAPILQVKDLTKRYGGLTAVNEVSFDVEPNEILSIIGPNGAGKSTIFKLISSFVKPTRGEVTFNGEVISGLAPHIVARKGVVRTFQETTIFKGMTARDSVIVAHHLRSRASLAGFYFGTAAARARRGGIRPLERRDPRLPRPRRRSATRSRATFRRAICARSASPSGLPPTQKSCCSTSPSPA